MPLDDVEVANHSRCTAANLKVGPSQGVVDLVNVMRTLTALARPSKQIALMSSIVMPFESARLTTSKMCALSGDSRTPARSSGNGR